MQRVHSSAVAAKKALVAEGFLSGFSSPGRPELWVHPKRKTRVAIGRGLAKNEVDEQWVIVPYPEPSSATPAEVIKLAERDGISLSGLDEGAGTPNAPVLPAPAEIPPDNSDLI